MADLKISQLPDVVGTPSPNSEIIVNEATGTDFVTKKASLQNLLGGLDGLTFFKPETIVMSDGPNQTGSSTIVDHITMWWQKRSPFTVKTSAAQTVNLPEGATHAIIVYSTWNKWNHALPPQDVDHEIGHARQYASHMLRCTSGGLFPTGSPELGNPGGPQIMIKTFYTHTVPYKQSLPQEVNNSYYSHLSKTKTKLLEVNAGATSLTFTAEVMLVMGGLNKMNAYMGDVLVLPFKASPDVASVVSAFLGGSVSDEQVPDEWEVTQDVADKSAAITAGNEFRKRAKHTIDVIDDYLQSYDEISGGGSIDTGLKDQLIRLENRVHAVVFKSMKLNSDDSLTPLNTQDSIEVELGDIHREVIGLVMEPFQFEKDLGVSRTTEGLYL